MARYVGIPQAPLRLNPDLWVSCCLDLFYEKRYAHTAMTNPDFVLLAKAMGVHAIRCTSSVDLPAAMKEFLEYPTDKPILLECCVEQNEHVYPMVSLYYVTCLSRATFLPPTHRWSPGVLWMKYCCIPNWVQVHPKNSRLLTHK